MDTNGLGNGLRDELLRPNVDVQTGETYLPWDAVNGEIRSEKEYSRVKGISSFFRMDSICYSPSERIQPQLIFAPLRSVLLSEIVILPQSH